MVKKSVARYTKDGLEKLADLGMFHINFQRQLLEPKLGPDGTRVKPSTGS